MNHGKGLLLAGPSSSGKSTLALALQDVLPEPWLFVPAENLTSGFPRQRSEFVTIEGDRRLRHGSMLAARGFLEAGVNVIIEQYLWDPWARDLAAEVFAPLDVFIVRLLCGLPTRERREATRPEINLGYARSEAEQRPWEFEHDLAVDSENESPEELARRVLAWMASSPEPAAFRRMQPDRSRRPH